MRTLDTAVLKLMVASASANLKNNRKRVDDLNVFPVPDGDTGTNMSLTFSGAAAAVAEYEATGADKLLGKLASAALRNARGNSGVILSQIIRGFSKGVEGKAEIGIEELKTALVSSKNMAYRAVMKPTEGTILTVIREISEYAEESFGSFSDIGEFMHAILERGRESLHGTTELLPVLKQAGVVDAGGTGLVTLIEGAVYVLDNGYAVECSEPDAAKTVLNVRKVDVDIKYLYCTEFIINKTRDRKVAQFRSAISEKGDCMLVIDDEEIVKVHIHTNHPGYVIEQALKLGELTNLKIDNMKYQHNEKINADTEKDEPENVADKAANNAETKPEPRKKYGFAAVSAGSGFAELFRSLNVDETVEGGQTMNPSTQDLADAVERVNADTVFILPNNKNIIMAAEQVDALCDRKVIVIPTVNIPQGLSAMMAFDESADTETNTETMKEFAASVMCGEVTFAARSTVLDGVEINEGDCLGINGKGIKAVTDTPENAVLELAGKLVSDDSSVLSVYYGEDTKKEDAEALIEKLEERYSDLDVSLCYGGQPVYRYILSVE